MEKKTRQIENVIRFIYKQWRDDLPKPHRQSCPDEETLACFVDGLLGIKKRDKVIEHLIRCNRCLECVIMSIRISR